MSTTNTAVDAAGFDDVQRETRMHRRRHGCDAYTFEDGAGLLALARTEKAARVIELGTAIGYTACLLASATPATRVETIERDPAHVRLARENVRAAGLQDRVVVHQGDFGRVLPHLAGPFDFAFFDGLGPTASLVDRLYDLLRPGGMLVCGNFNLAADADRRVLAAEFARAGRWSDAGSIEGGLTRAFRKVASTAHPEENDQ